MHSFDGLAHTFRCVYCERNVNAADHKNAFFGFDFPTNARRQASLIRIDLARCQRAPEGSQQSAGSCRYDIVDGCSVRFADFVHIDAIMLGDITVDAERHRLFFPG